VRVRACVRVRSRWDFVVHWPLSHMPEANLDHLWMVTRTVDDRMKFMFSDSSVRRLTSQRHRYLGSRPVHCEPEINAVSATVGVLHCPHSPLLRRSLPSWKAPIYPEERFGMPCPAPLPAASHTLPQRHPLTHSCTCVPRLMQSRKPPRQASRHPSLSHQLLLAS
jgi:hypothetical protein